MMEQITFKKKMTAHTEKIRNGVIYQKHEYVLC